MKKGAKGRDRLRACRAGGGTFFEPTVLTDVTTDMVVSKEKTFGPVAPLHRFKTDAEAIEMANEAPARGGGKQGAAPICRSATSAASGVSPRRWNTGIVGTDEGIIPDAKA